MTRYIPLLLVVLVACDSTRPIDSVSDELPAAEPGFLLPFSAPQSDGLFPQIAWDSKSDDLVLPDHPNAAPTTLVRFGVETGSKTTLDTIEPGLQLVAGGGGAVFYTTVMKATGAVTRDDGVEVASVTGAQFAVSRNGRWIVVRDRGWVEIELATGLRRRISNVPRGLYPLAIDSTGSRVAFGIVGRLSEYDPSITIADLSLGTTQSVLSPGTRLLAVEFIGDRPLLLGFSITDDSSGSRLTFSTGSDVANSTKTVGVVAVQNRGSSVGVCGSWSPDAGYGVGVVQVRYPAAMRARHEILKLGTDARVVGTADLWDPTDCTLSPDGKWFVYGNGTGFVTPGDLYLKPIH